jgi:5-methylcytosine-specific restriction endonuclease McrA
MTAKYKFDKIRKARKAHACTDCGAPISVGTEYMEQTHPIVRGGSPEYIPADRWCESCAGKRGLLAA